MTGFMSLGRIDVDIRVSDELIALKQAILNVFIKHGEKTITQININCKDTINNGIICMTMFDSVIANMLLGKRKTAALMFNYIVETLKHEYNAVTDSEDEHILYWYDADNIQLIDISDLEDEHVLYWYDVTDQYTNND